MLHHDIRLPPTQYDLVNQAKKKALSEETGKAMDALYSVIEQNNPEQCLLAYISMTNILS